MPDFTSEDLTGSRFEDVFLTDARFHDVDLTNARFHLVEMTGVVIRGAALVNVEISGEIKDLRSTASTSCPWWRRSSTVAIRTA